MIDIAPIKARLERLDAAVEDAASTGMMRITSELMGARQAFQVNAVNDVRLLLAEIESMRAQQMEVSEIEDLRTLPPGAVILDAEKNVLWRGGGGSGTLSGQIGSSCARMSSFLRLCFTSRKEKGNELP